LDEVMLFSSSLFFFILFLYRHQLDAEIKKRLKAEQSVDHMVSYQYFECKSKHYCFQI